MIKNLIVLFIAFLAFFYLKGQEYYVPHNLKMAYENGTRDYSGKPGANYFQNFSRYSIDVYFDPDKGILTGNEKIWYFNRSEDSINYLVIRLYHNILRKGNIRDEEIPASDVNSGVNIQSLVIGNIEHIGNSDFFQKRKGTNLIISLPEVLNPSDSILIAVKWKSNLPHNHLHRFGKYNKSDWFVAYWYPQVAVYDDIDGWDVMDYTGTTEFYNDFADFDVRITVPGKHLIWATGELQNAGSIYSKPVLEKYRTARTSRNLVHVVNEKDWKGGQVFLKSGKNKYHFKASQVTDFAFAVSDNYIWDAQTVQTSAKKTTTVQAVYPASASNFEHIASFGAKSVNHFSEISVGIPYPFDQVTIFNGDGGMEFPMMVNQRAASKAENNFVAMHEIFHGYFPFMTGLNEKKYAWLDEGLTTYLPIITEEALGGNYFTMPKISHYYNMLSGEDVESLLMSPSYLLRGYSYHHQAYFRSSVALFILEDYLGREKFRDALRTFTDNWKGKHPTGYDFIFSLENATGESLFWLIDPWFFRQGWADLELTSANITKDKKLTLKVSNIGGMPVPVYVVVIKPDGSAVSRKFGSEIWKEGTKEVTLMIEGVSTYKSVTLGNPNVPDKNMGNNQIKY